jgi:hypothetical protein
MHPIRAIKSSIYNWQVKRKGVDRGMIRYFVELNDARHVCVLYIADSASTVKLVKAWKERLQEQGKNVKTLGYVERKAQKTLTRQFSDMEFLLPGEVNWWYRPKGTKTSRLLDKEFDLWINLFQKVCKPLEYLALLSKSKMRVGRYLADHSLYYNDFLVDIPEEADLQQFIEQIEHYLNPKKRS